jgi:hypothetical protein
MRRLQLFRTPIAHTSSNDFDFDALQVAHTEDVCSTSVARIPNSGRHVDGLKSPQTSDPGLKAGAATWRHHEGLG